MAIVVSSLTDQTVDPPTMAEWAYQNGYWCSGNGSYHSLIPGAAEGFGLQWESISTDDPQAVVDTLASGKLIVALMSKGHFTSSGHFMAKFEYMQRAFSSELKPRARLVLQVLVLHCNKEGECFPSIKTIAAKCGYGVSTVKRALDELVKAGYIVKQARFDERKNGGQTSNLYTLCSDLLCPDEPENAPVLEDDASDESPAVQPESAPADACNASDPTPGEQSATLPTADSYSFADGFETKIGRQFCRPIRMWTGGQSIFIPP